MADAAFRCSAYLCPSDPVGHAGLVFVRDSLEAAGPTFFRVLQGAVSGPMIPGSRALLLSLFPAEKKGIALALWSMTTLVAPICGPILGGYISDNYPWRAAGGVGSRQGLGLVLQQSHSHTRHRDLAGSLRVNHLGTDRGVTKVCDGRGLLT